MMAEEEHISSYSGRPLPRTTSFNEANVAMAKPKTGSKKRKRMEDDDDRDLDEQNGINKAIGMMNSSMLADLLARKTKKFGAELSMVELEDKRLPEHTITDTSEYLKPRTLANLPDYLEKFTSVADSKTQLSSASEQTGSPHTLVVTGAGLRAADLARTLRVFKTEEAAIAKLFAKHIKLKDAIEFTSKTRIGIGIGTPHRLIELLDSGALSISNLRRLMVDCSHIDQKKRGILDMRETWEPLLQLLNRPEIRTRYGQAHNSVHLFFY